MNILLLGGGGREHAIAWKISQSPLCTQLFIAPGNAGTATCGRNAAISPTDFDAIRLFCLQEKIGMVIVGPEDPLVKGIVEYFAGQKAIAHIPVIGPGKIAAQLEGSKAFSKKFMERHHIPTAAYKEFSAGNFQEGLTYLQQLPLPIVLKADGLAGGKGVIIAQSHIEATSEFELMIQESKFGEASKKVVVEEFLTGIELSVFVLTDGKNYCILPEAKDYKRIGEGDKGLNTGGMGAISPVPFADEAFMKLVEEKTIIPTIKGLQEDGIEYKGFIFIGLMKVGNEPYVIEYNCRMGDPETEVVFPRLQNDLVELFIATSQQKLNEITIKVDSRVAATVIVSSRGYPGAYEKGYEISGLDTAAEEDTIIFHAGTANVNGKIITNSGRVLAVTSLSRNIDMAVAKSMNTIENIDFDGMYYRKDIGYEFMG
jgi:phosphoribosylamine---glycine ligase